MTRLSDALRGLADRAPIDDLSVSTSGATRRIKRGRRLRAAANATAGVGVAGVIALAALQPGMTSGDSADSAATPEMAAAGEKGDLTAYDGAEATQLAWAQCGSVLTESDMPMASDAFSLSLGDLPGEAESGATIDVALTLTRADDVAEAFTTPGPSYLVLWAGMVVGTGQVSGDIGVQDLSDNIAAWDGKLDLVNCWDGSPLPAGAYEVVAFQDFYVEATEAPLEPTSQPSLEPAEPTTEPTTEPATGGAQDTTAQDTTAQDTSTSSTAIEGTIGSIGPEGEVAADRAISNRVALVIAGDAVENPFDQYLQPAAPAIVYPADYLTPAAARSEYEARATENRWDMAAGTQRVLKTGDSLTSDDGDAWLESYYGCSADGVTAPSFPTTSAEWSMLAVDFDLPSSVGLSYGWVVDGNPVVDVTVTNTSGYTLPGFWGEPSTSLYLVQDGKVVATSYLTAADQTAYLDTSSTDGLLSAGASLDGTYLWRDVSGCWLGDSQSRVEPGTYTVISSQDVYFDSGYTTFGVDPSVSIDGAARSGGASAQDAEGVTSSYIDEAKVGELSLAPAPVDGTYDWVTLQVWTSLGQVTLK